MTRRLLIPFIAVVGVALGVLAPSIVAAAGPTVTPHGPVKVLPGGAVTYTAEITTKGKGGPVPVPGVTVTWTATGGTPLSQSTLTDADGKATYTYTAGTIPGTYAVTATYLGDTTTRTVTVLDVVPPTVVCIPPSTTPWYKADVAVPCTASDSGTGLKESGDASFVLETNGQGTSVSTSPYTVCDNATPANCTTVQFGGYQVDKMNPVITPTAVTADSSPYIAGTWTNQSVTVTFGCQEPGGPNASGVSINTLGGATLTGDGANQSVTNSGVCQDAAGNSAQSKTFGPINIDKTPPTVVATASPAANANGWNNTDVTVTFAGTDTLSGIASCNAATTLTGEGGGQVVTGSCTDYAGNSTSATTTINIDKTPPTVVATASPAANANGWNNTDVTVSFSGSDALSGIDTCTAHVTVTTEGSGQSAAGTCTDKAGNVSDPASVENINIDKTKPTVAVTGVAAGATYTLGAVPVAGCTTTDALSGVATHTTVSVAGGNANGVGTFTATCAGAADKADNAAAAVSATYSVVYAFGGFLQPIPLPVSTFNGGSTIPVKFRLTNASGVSVATAVASVSVPASQGTSGIAKYDAASHQYHYNLKTNALPKGSPSVPMTITMTADDGVARTVTVTIR